MGLSPAAGQHGCSPAATRVWTQQDKLVGSGAVGNAEQGVSVALSGDGNVKFWPHNLRFGVPIVTTPFGVQGMTELEATLPVHSDPTPLAEAVFTLLTDDAAWRTQRRIQSEYVRRHFLLADVGNAAAAP
jgi:hypothetical protein